MATVNYSVPDDIKQAFNATFSGHNKSAIIAKLMQKAIEEEHLRQRRAQAIDRLNNRHSERGLASSEEVQEAREELRK